MTTIRVSRSKASTIVAQTWLMAEYDRAPSNHAPAPVRTYEPVVKRGIRVKHEAANIADPGYRVLAGDKHRAKSHRFAPSGIPRGVDQTSSLPHDCNNHLPAEDGRFQVRLPAMAPGKVAPSIRMYWEALDAATV